MSHPSNRVKQAIGLGEFLESLEGKTVQVSQLLSWRPGSDFERHSTVHIRLSFRVKSVTWAMSGGHFTLWADDDITSYGIGTTMLEEFTLTGDTAAVTELYGTGAERRSVIEVAAGAA
ncbi:hypothetical protein [Stenotrophomonas sp. PS02298]|uniref:hypothetical protein n=1 Tax=Stenotrophomonas sp. PS02298 TaxID=2991424 RepID=UPI00249C507F|nr:hypothetical protein [Stenotrophomonas sp. PS02298]